MAKNSDKYTPSNKTVQDPGGKDASDTASRAGVDITKGYDVISRPGVLESPTGPRKT